MNWKRIVPLLLLLYVFFLILKLPASRVVASLDVPQQDFAFQRMEGTLFSGNADQAAIDRFPIGWLQWRLEPSALLLGCLQYRLELDGPALQDGQGRVGSCLGSRAYVKDFSARLDARELGILASHGLLALGGKAELDIDTLEWGDEAYGEASGSAVWRAAVIEGGKALRLGTVTVSFAQEDGNLMGRLGNRGGDVALTGSVTLDRGGRYQAQAHFAGRNGGQPPAWLGTLARRQRDGGYLLRHTGNL